MPNTGKFTKHVQLYLEPEVHQLLRLLAERQKTTLNDVIRIAICQYVDAQEDMINSRTRTEARVVGRLEKIQNHLLEQGEYQTRLQLAAMVVLLTEQGVDTPGTLARIVELADHPKIVQAAGGKS